MNIRRGRTTFIQIHEVSEDAEVCFVAFSSRFLESINFIRTISNLIVTIIENPVVPLPGNAATIYKDFFSLLVRADNAPDGVDGLHGEALFLIELLG